MVFTRMLVACQMLMALAGVLTIAFVPRTGDETVLLYPLSSQSKTAMHTALSDPEIRILSVGSLTGSLIVRGEHPGFVQSLVRDRILVLRASAPGCGPASREVAS